MTVWQKKEEECNSSATYIQNNSNMADECHCQSVKYDSCKRLPEKNVIDLFTYKRAKPQKFAINTVQDRFQKITFARVLRIEQFQQLQHKLLIDDAFTDGRLKVRTLQEPESYKVPHQVPANINREKN